MGSFSLTKKRKNMNEKTEEEELSEYKRKQHLDYAKSIQRYTESIEQSKKCIKASVEAAKEVELVDLEKWKQKKEKELEDKFAAKFRYFLNYYSTCMKEGDQFIVDYGDLQKQMTFEEFYDRAAAFLKKEELTMPFFVAKKRAPVSTVGYVCHCCSTILKVSGVPSQCTCRRKVGYLVVEVKKVDSAKSLEKAIAVAEQVEKDTEWVQDIPKEDDDALVAALKKLCKKD